MLGILCVHSNLNVRAQTIENNGTADKWTQAGVAINRKSILPVNQGGQEQGLTAPSGRQFLLLCT